MEMFKPKKGKQAQPVEEKLEEEVIEDEDEEDMDKEEIVKTKKKVNKEKSTGYNIGEIIPIEQIVGYQVVKELDDSGNPIVTMTEKLSEAEILSFIYQQ